MAPAPVALLVLGILALQLMIWIPVLLWLRRKSDRLVVDLQRALAVAGEHTVLGPVPASYRGATSGSGYPHARGNSVAALTHRRLVIRRLVGEPVEIPVADITSVREDQWFLRAYASGRLVVIIKTTSGAEVGLMVKNHDEWMAALRARIAA